MNTVSVTRTGAGVSSLIPLDQYLTLVEFVASQGVALIMLMLTAQAVIHSNNHGICNDHN